MPVIMRLIINLSLLFSPPSSQILGWEWRESGGMGMGRESGEKRERKKEELPPSPFKHWKKPAHSLLLSCKAQPSFLSGWERLLAPATGLSRIAN